MDRLEINWFLLQGNTETIEEHMHPEDVTIVDNPSRHRKVNLGCRVLFRDEHVESIEQYIDHDRTIVPKPGKTKSARKRNKYFRFLDTLPQCALVIDLHTFYTVQWQDGTISKSVKSTDLVGYDPAGVNEFWPGTIVCRAAEELDHRDIDFSTWGVVRSTSIEDQMVTVAWVTENGNRLESLKIESLSLYSLILHPEYNSVLPEKLVVKENDGELPLVQSVGEVIEITDGNCTVCWLDGTITTVGIDRVTFLDDEIDYDECEDYGSEEEENSLGEDSDSEVDEEETKKLTEEAKEAAKNEDPAVQSGAVKDAPSYPTLQEFSRFASVSEVPENHHYLPQSVTLAPRPSRAVVKDWMLLQNNLPEGVFVRAFDSHLDLLQLLIIGPKNTPYCKVLSLQSHLCSNKLFLR